MEIQQSKNLPFILQIGKFSYHLNNVSISKSTTAVTKPTKRGGIYFSDTFAFKIKANVNDLSVVDLLSKSMLGPNQEFQELEVTTSIPIRDSNKKVTFFVYLTNSMQNSSRIELNMTIIRLTID